MLVAGARPNFMKVAALVEAIRRYNVETHMPVPFTLVHTGQHYDERMSETFFRDLRLPAPDVNLGVGSGTHAWQTAEIMRRFERVCLQGAPDCVVVVGDVNSTIACTLVAKKLNIQVAHVEAGLRSFDRSMPEELNRVLTDAVSDFLFASEEDACVNLRREGIPESRVYFVGNVMVDTLLAHRLKARESDILMRAGLSTTGAYVLLTLHRPSNVDDPRILSEVLNAAREISGIYPVVFPVHPRTMRSIQKFGFADHILWVDHRASVNKVDGAGIYGLPPLSYLEFLHVMANARVVMTDSGGVQEETTILRVPCVTVRNNTERPVTISQGTNRLAGTTANGIVKSTIDAMSARYESVGPPALWDGNSGRRIVSILSAPSYSEVGLSSAGCGRR